MCEILTVEQTAEAIPALTEPAIRWHLFNRKANGLSQSGAIINSGRRIFIELPIYIEWLRSQGANHGQS